MCHPEGFIYPYKVHDKCLARAYEIAKGMPIHMPDYYPKSYKCVDMDNADKVQTTWQQRNVED